MAMTSELSDRKSKITIINMLRNAIEKFAVCKHKWIMYPERNNFS